jgi:hypothetical protein
MSFLATLTIEGETFELISVSIELSQAVDAVGRPTSSTRGGKISFDIHSTPTDLWASWMMAPRATKDGSLTLWTKSEGISMQTITFTNAYCIDMTENFDDTYASFNLMLSIIISAQKLKIGEVRVVNDWPQAAN